MTQRTAKRNFAFRSREVQDDDFHFVTHKSGVYDVNYIVNVVSKIIIETDGTVTVEMINGTKINNREVGNANAGKKNRNENRCESDSRKAE